MRTGCVVTALVAAMCAKAWTQGSVGTPAVLTPLESAMVASVDRETPAGLELLRQLVEINSGTMNLAGVRAVGAVLQPRFEALGFKTRWVNMDRVHRAGHLVAEHPCVEAGKCGKRMLLIGHMDTVFEQDSPFQHWSVDGDTATGPGVNDMKGGLVVMLMALDAMQAAGVLKDADITVVLDGDEEAHGAPAEISRADLVAAAKKADVALEFEATPRSEGVYYGSIARRSSTSWHVKTSGNTGHSAGIFNERMGYGAIYELTRILDSFRRELPEQYLTYNVGLIGGGARLDSTGDSWAESGKTNIVAPIAEAAGDLRTISNDQTMRIEAKMRAIVADHLSRTGAEIYFSEGYPAMPPTDTSREVLKTLSGASEALGFGAMPEYDPMMRGAGDIAFVAGLLPGIAGVGATGTGSHAPGETVDLPSQAVNAKRDAVLMYRLSLEK